MADPIIDVWSRKIETPHHGYWQGGYREDSHTKWCELRGAWSFGQSSEEKNQLTRAIAAEEQPKFDLLITSTHQIHVRRLHFLGLYLGGGGHFVRIDGCRLEGEGVKNCENLPTS